MAAKKRGLGRGLDALIPGAFGGQAPSPAKADGDLRELPVELIQRGQYQPRHGFDSESLEELAASIRAQGVVQPIVVRSIGPDTFEIIAGERRWRAAQMAGLQTIPAVVRDVPDQAAVAMALIENIQREDLNPLEEANALKRLIDEFGLTHQQTAEAVGRSRTAVSNLLRLLELAPAVKEMVDQRRLEMGHARALLALDPQQQEAVGRQVASRGLSVRETEALVRRVLHPPAPKAEKAMDPDIRRLQDELGSRLGARVQIQHGSAGKGRLVIQYNDLDELDGILAHIK
jgi:ParB family chromosome partitioning protein